MMTHTKDILSGLLKKDKDGSSAKDLIFGFMGLFCLALFIKNASVATGCMKEGLRLCANTVIPSLFPFMVIANIISVVKIPTINKIFDKPFRKIFGVSGECAQILLIGNLCGFPVGAKLGSRLLDEGRITKKELERSLVFSSNPSSAFVISTVGLSLFSSKEFGIKLYAVTLTISLLSTAVHRLIFGGVDNPSPLQAPKNVSQKKNLPSRFCEAIGDAALSVIGVSAFILFFSAFLGTLEYVFSRFLLSDSLRALIVGIFEMIGGTSRAAELKGNAASILAAFSVGWSGISVHLQIFSIICKKGVSMKPYLLSKLLQGILTAVVIYFITL